MHCDSIVCMSKERDRLLLWGGILIGAAFGLAVGMFLFVIAMVEFMHHMFIFGFHWTLPGAFLIFVPILLLILATILLRRAKRLPA